MNDTDSALPVPATPPEDSAWDHSGALAAAALAGALALGGLLYMAGAFGGDTGDEPPIRVKGGSVDFYLASKKQLLFEKTFNQKDPKDPKKFTIGGKRSKDGLDLTVAVNAGGSCSSTVATAEQVTIEYTKADNKVVTIMIGTDPDRPHQKHTAVWSAEALTLSSTDARELSFVETGGYISAIKLDANPQPLCTFKNADQLAHLLIMDY